MPGISEPALAAAALQKGDSLSSIYTHLHREEVRPISSAEENDWKRMNLNVPVQLHNDFKAATAAEGEKMTTVLLEFIEKYVADHAPSKKKSRRA